jgi:hypothetical protein
MEYYLFLTNVRVPNTRVLLNVTAQVLSPASSAFLSGRTLLPEVTTSRARWLEHPRLLVEKMFSTTGFSPNLRFWVTPALVTLNTTSFIYVRFPQYYAPRLGNGQIYVIVNNKTMNYDFDSPYTIRITHFTSVININQTFELEIQGVLNPVISTLRPFIVILDNNDDANHIIEYGEVMDWAVSATNPQQLNVLNVTVESNQVIQKTKYMFEFAMPIAVFEKRNFTITFSRSWGSHLSRSAPTCQIKNQTDNLETDWQDLPCKLTGSKLNITSPRNYTQNNVYVLRVLDLSNPQEASCQIEQPLFQIASNDIKYVEYTTYPAFTQWPLYFIEGNGLLYWTWEILVKGVYQPVQGNLRLRPGSYSPQMRLTLDGNLRAASNLKLNLINFYSNYADFQLYPQNPQIKMGTNGIEIRFGCPASTLSGNYELFFDLDQPSPQEYAVPVSIKIDVVNEPVPIPPLQRNRYNLPVLGISENIQFDMSENPPFTPINIDLVLPYYPDIGVDLVLTGRFKISAENPTGFTYIQSNYYFTGMPTSSYLYLDLADDVPNRAVFALPANNYFNISLIGTPSIPKLQIELAEVNTNTVRVLVSYKYQI